MYKNLTPSAIGVFGRQGELVEIALTHRFKGLEIDILEVLRRAQTTGAQQACRYLSSASMQIGGFELPVRLNAEEKVFQTDLAQLGLLLEICAQLSADRCHLTIAPTCDQKPFHENFQFTVQRLQQVADALATGNVRLGLNFLSAQSDRADGGFQFIHQADPLLLLINSVQRDNVGLLFDAWHWHVGGGDLEKLRALRGDQIISVRLSDIPSGTDLATITNEQRTLPGENATIDAAAIVTTLDEIGYSGPVALSCWPGLSKGQTRESIVRNVSSSLDSLLAPVTGEKPVGAAGT